MASIEVIIRDGQGTIISPENIKELNQRHATLDTIEAEVETWGKQALPEIEAQLLEQAQAEFTAQEKTI
jgi:hypothetical protein